MTGKEKMVNFCYQIDRPFTTQEACEKCEVNYNTGKKHLRALREAGKIRIMRKKGNANLLIWCEKPEEIKETPDWVPRTNKLHKIITVMKIGKKQKISDIISRVTFSESTLRRYLRILHGLGVVSRDKNYRYTLTGKQLPVRVNSYIRERVLFGSSHNRGEIDNSDVTKLLNSCKEGRSTCELLDIGIRIEVIAKAASIGLIKREKGKYIARRQ